jgi:hypothetical protein
MIKIKMDSAKEQQKRYKGWGVYIKKPIPIKAVQMLEAFEVETLEGPMQGKAGDYLVIGIKGEMYPCDREIFEKTYRLLKDSI